MCTESTEAIHVCYVPKWKDIVLSHVKAVRDLVWQGWRVEQFTREGDTCILTLF